jgi:hypothetical protein
MKKEQEETVCFIPHPSSLIPYSLLWGCAAGLLLVAGGQAGYVMLGGNFHTVIPGRVYRCAQLSAAGLERVIRRHGIRTVLNLRGRDASSAWYPAECEVTQRLGVVREDIELCSTHVPWPDEVRGLVEVLERSRYPVLIHCERGGDRTGLASAVVLLLTEGASLAEARGQLGLRYGHVRLGAAALDRFLHLYEDWLHRNGREHSPAAFRCWAGRDYCPGEYRAALEVLEVPRWVPRDRPWAVRVRCHNDSVQTWGLRPGKNAGIHLGYVLRDDRDGSSVQGRSGLFHGEVAPGQNIDLTLSLPARPTPGRYSVLVDMVKEGECWFHEAGSRPLRLQVEVR